MQDNRRVALVTGASSGIGRTCAALLAARGFRVYGVSRRVPDTPGVTALAMDVTDEGSVLRGVDTVVQREGRLDIVVNSAGMGIGGAVEDTTVEEAGRQFDVNFFGVLRVCRAALPAMRRQRAGYIVNIGSIGGLIAIPYQGLYSASKFAIEGLTEALRLEVRSFGIHAVLIEPGDHRTSFTERRSLTLASNTSEYRDRAQHAIARMASDEQNGPSPEAVARLLLSIVNKRHPRLRYTVGPLPQRVAVWLKRLTPYTVMERVMGAYYSC